MKAKLGIIKQMDMVYIIGVMAINYMKVNGKMMIFIAME
jgi:hypothetical protein